MASILEIASKFALDGKAVDAKPCGSGLINDTYLITTESDETPNYILQRINHSIFTDVDLLQENMVKITEHIRKRLEQAGAEDIDRRTLTVVPTKDGKLYYFDGESYWRVTVEIKDCVTHEQGTPEMAYRTGRAFGEFHAYFIGDDVPVLGETIPDFHNMYARMRQHDEAIKANKM
ncbi:MAG: aminoglycoside phosphotransferase family protein, partial [Muribaculaceae bacterium]|nr:aminoglycoside phosphotransferase family protein [Muribaculaceae bacterium]